MALPVGKTHFQLIKYQYVIFVNVLLPQRQHVLQFPGPGLRQVIQFARVGEQVGATWKLVSILPAPASASRFGVLISPPNTPRSSAMINRMLGRGSGLPVASRSLQPARPDKTAARKITLDILILPLNLVHHTKNLVTSRVRRVNRLTGRLRLIDTVCPQRQTCCRFQGDCLTSSFACILAVFPVPMRVRV